jgi:hypothetical protein
VVTLTSAFAVAGWAGFGASTSLLPGSQRPKHVFGLPGQYERRPADTLTAGTSAKATLRVASLILLVLSAALLASRLDSRSNSLICSTLRSSSGGGTGLLVAVMLDCPIFPRSHGEARALGMTERWVAVKPAVCDYRHPGSGKGTAGSFERCWSRWSA